MALKKSQQKVFNLNSAQTKDLKWWQKAVFYQIYPRSFADGNGDGIGDFSGMIEKLDYLQWLGVDAIWLSPHYPSPQVDWGYDISDYCGVDPAYGNMEQFKQFLDGLHQRGMRLILDLVLNHTSDQHPWFLESRASQDSPKRDWYIWKPPREGGYPNDWYSTFGGSAWTMDDVTGEYYYHYFFKEQPDLNWKNPEVKQAMFDAVRFWLNLGVDGFRLDAIGTVYESEGMPGHGMTTTLDDLYVMSRTARTKTDHERIQKVWMELFHHQVDQPEVHALMRELRRVIDEYPGKVLVGETDDIRFYGDGHDELHLSFNFALMRTNRMTPQWVRKNQDERLNALPTGSWPCNTLGNHDSARMMSEFGDGENDLAIARVNLAMLLTLWGTPFLYNGEEIGMTNTLVDDPRWFRDPLCARAYRLETQLLGSSHIEAVQRAARDGRDKTRTPMQWANRANAGFSPDGVETWLPVNQNYRDGVNVEDQLTSDESLLKDYQSLLEVRLKYPALVSGSFSWIRPEDKNVLAYVRETDHQACIIVLNMSKNKQTFILPDRRGNIRQVYSTLKGTPLSNQGQLSLEPFSVVIFEANG